MPTTKRTRLRYVLSPLHAGLLAGLVLAATGCGGGGGGGGSASPGGPVGKGNPPVLSSITPTSGPIAGGTVVTLLGSGFQSGGIPASIEVRFAGARATDVVVVDDTRVTATTPRVSMSGAADVTVSNANGSSTLPAAFLYLAPVSVAWVSPPTGPIPGGTSVRIRGTGFLYGVDTATTQIIFGGTNATNVQVIDDSTILAVTPAQAGYGMVNVAISNSRGFDNKNGAYLYATQIPVTGVSPALGPIAGGTPVTITGSGFQNGVSPGSTLVTFQGGVASNVVVVDDTTITATTPFQGVSGYVDVMVQNSVGAGAAQDAFVYFGPVQVTKVTPAAGGLAGGFAATVGGVGFAIGVVPGTTTVGFGSQPATNVVVVDDTAIQVTVPAATKTGAVAVTVSNSSGAFSLIDAFFYASGVELLSVQPGSGPAAGGTPVTLQGTGFADGVQPGSTVVTFAGAPATGVTVIDDSAITAITPPGLAGGPVDVAVSNSRGTALLPGAFQYVGSLYVSSIQPSSGPVTGGVTVTVQGGGFQSGVTPGSELVTFDGVAGSNLVVVDDQTMTVVTPAAAGPGSVDVTVSNSTGSVVVPGGFTYEMPLNLASVTPASGPLVGGTTITITGSGLQTGVQPGSTVVSVGAASATNVTIVSDTTITATTPAATLAGPVDVVVTNSNGTGFLPGAFTYFAPLSAVTLQPGSGPVKGGTAVTISGAGFLYGVTPGSTTVSFGGNAATNLTILSDTMLSCRTPAGVGTGPVSVGITNSSGSVSLPNAFTYVPNPPTPTGELLTVLNPDAFDRYFEPVTIGVPFPEPNGPTDTSNFRLMDAATGLEVPAQWTILTRWNGLVSDSTLPIRVVLLDFQAPFVPAKGSAQFAVDTTTPAQPWTSPLVVTDTGTEIVVATGPLEATIDKTRFNLFRKVRIDTDGDGTPDRTVVDSAPGTFYEDNGVVITRTDGTNYQSALGDSNVSVTVEEAGPLRAVIAVTSRHESKTDLGLNLTNGASRLQYDWLEQKTRYHFFANQPWVKVVYALRYTDRRKQGEYNQGGSWVLHRMEDLTFQLKPIGWSSPSQATVAAESSDWEDWFDDKPNHPQVGQTTVTRTLASGADSLGLYQDSSGVYNWGNNSDGKWGTSFRGYRVDASGTVVDQGLQALGAIRSQDANVSITAGLRWFWQQFPSQLRTWGAGGIHVSPFPGAFQNPHDIKGGRQRMFEMYFAFEPASATTDLEQFALARNRPLEGRVDPEYAQSTEAFGLFSLEDPTNDPTYFGRYEQIATFFVDGPKHPYNTPPENPDTDKFGYDFRVDMYGFGFGDAWRGGDKNTPYYGNNELDVPWACFNQWQRKATPDYRFFQLGEISARDYFNHTIYHTDQDNPAYNWVTHTNDQSGQKYKTALPNYSHCWIEGVLRYWWATGDAFALEAALELGEGFKVNIDANGDLAYSNETRAQAWTGRNLHALHDATGDPAWFTMLQKMLYTEIINDNQFDPVFSFGNTDSRVLDWFGGANAYQKLNKGQKGNGVCDIWQNCEVIEYFLGPYCLKLRKLGMPDLVAEMHLQLWLEAIEEYAWATPQNGKFTFSTDWVQDGITFTGGVSAIEKDNVIYGQPFEMMPADELYGDGDYVLKAFHPYLPGAFAWGEILGLANLGGPTARQMIQDSLRWFLGPDSITQQTASQYGETPYVYSWRDDVFDTKNAALAKESATKLALVEKGLHALQKY